MATPKIIGRDSLRNNFSTGQKPTGANFADLIESFLNLSDDDINTKKVGERNHVGFGSLDPKSPISIKENDGALISFEEKTGDPNWEVRLSENADGNVGLRIGHTTQPEQVFIQDNGNTGLGTHEPTARFEVSGSQPDIKVGTPEKAMHIEQTEQGTYLGFGGTGNKAVFKNGTDITTKPSESGEELLTLTEDGKVGIGTTDPASKFQVVGDKMTIGSTEEGIHNIVVSENQVQGQSGVEAGTLILNGQGGHVAIGSADPKAQVHIEGQQEEVLLLKNDGATKLQLQGSTESIGEIKIDDNREITIQSSTSDELTKVAIQSATEIVGQEASQFTIINKDENHLLFTADDTPSIKFRHKDGIGTQLQLFEQSKLRVSNGDGGYLSAFIVDGLVGIGTENPSATLEVAGNVKSENCFESHKGNVIRDALFNYTNSELTDTLYIVTSLTKGSDIMYRLTLEGYNYLDSAIINSEVVGHTGTDQTLPETTESDPITVLEEGILNAQVINHGSGIEVTQHYLSNGLLVLALKHPIPEEATEPVDPKPYHLGFSASFWFINETAEGNEIEFSVTQDLTEAAN